ncbi:MAG: ATP-binding protein [Niabella sp.]|nr:ATP-binding protein [Niabella sp.]
MEQKKIPVLLSWSGGKDAAYTLHRLQQSALYDVRYLLTTFNKDHRSAMHETPERLIEAQSQATGIPLLKVFVPENDANGYEKELSKVLLQVRQEGIETVAFGDMHLDDLRAYREKQLAQIGFKALFPIWNIDSYTYLIDFFRSGFRSVICCVNASMLPDTICGELLTPALIASFPATADPCGENGEYHSFCFEGPVFRHPIPYKAAGFFEKRFPSPVAKRKQIRLNHLDLIRC